MIDQFGYRPASEKVAVIRDPQVGFDAAQSFTPGSEYELVNADTSAVVFTAAISPWNGGATHTGSSDNKRYSGDKAWWFDFSSVTAAGNYFVRDKQNGAVSHTFAIDSAIYRNVLKQAFRTFFYQRAGHDKHEPRAEAAWADDSSHSQDAQARIFNDKDNASTEKDLSGGWYDAGDYNKYTNWTADYVIALLHSYMENPSVWGDDFNIPESGNGIPDILDEVKWGMDWLIKMQNTDGSVLSIVGLDHASPPSAATGPSYYGPANTSATLTTAAAFALGAKVFASLRDTALAADLQSRAVSAWGWADANPSEEFFNNSRENDSEGLGAGQQEVDDSGRVIKKLEAAVYLFELTGEASYKNYFDSNYQQTELIDNGGYYSSAFTVNITHYLLYYAALDNATTSVANTINDTFVSAMGRTHAWAAINSNADPYMAYIQVYTWGSSGVKANKGSMFYEQILYDLGTQSDTEIKNAAEHYLHYLHGVNPLGKVYLSNMGAHGAENSVDQFYHTWFSKGSARWSSVQGSTHGPAPGFLVGGPNPYYDWDGCCPNSCGTGNNSKCGTARLSPPYSQPAQKSYIDFNDSWPINSWEVTENSNGYQVRYLRLLSKFVE